VRDVLISGGTHLGFLERARKWTDPFDLLEIWMERQAYREARLIVAHSDLLATDLTTKYHVPAHKLGLCTRQSMSGSTRRAIRLPGRSSAGGLAGLTIVAFFFFPPWATGERGSRS
jgi:hypothetical protein